MKEFYKSKMLWTNLIVFITAIGTALTGEATFDTAAAPMGLALANIVLRFFTSTKLIK